MLQRIWLVTVFSVVLGAASSHAQIPELASELAPSTGAVAAPSEPGQRMLIAGRVRDAASHQSIAGASVYIYQTDTTGLYTPDTNDNRNPRLYAHLRSDTSGAFEAGTIRPAPYPRGGVPAHIHFVVQATGYSRRVFEIVFDDDPLVTADIRSRATDPASAFVVVKPPSGSGGRIELDVLMHRGR
jgi:protocatechuate 3,4-dioxygenase beta subunit